jgi:hypothetical protein
MVSWRLDYIIDLNNTVVNPTWVGDSYYFKQFRSDGEIRGGNLKAGMIT